MKESQLEARALVMTMQMQGLGIEKAIRCAFVSAEKLIACTLSVDTMVPGMPITKNTKEFWVEVREELMKI